MQFPESWLRQYCNPSLTTQQLADTLTMAGLEVEDLQPVAPLFCGVVVGEIKDVAPHPNADRLRVCLVDVARAELLSIVCGAANARPGLRVPCATVGAELPPGADGAPFRIKLGKLRGVESHGMLCSAKELGISDDQDGLMELSADAPVGQDIRTHLVLDDSLFTLKLTPNLAHCLSIYGIARELAALTGAPLRKVQTPNVKPEIEDRLSVQVLAHELCGRFSGRIVRGVNSRAKTPQWMVDRLARCGQRSVSALVDISNYVMFDMGQPSHMFDLDKIHGALSVRWANVGERLQLLNGSTVTLDETVGVIADEQQVESLAGIMGGDATAVSDDTCNVYVETAFWWPKSVAGRSRRFNFSTDAGHRFERGVDPAMTVHQLECITRLVLDICGGQAGPVDDSCPHMPKPRSVSLRVERASKVLGMPLTEAQCQSALEGLGLSVVSVGGVLMATAPTYRFDIQIEEDLIEEIARVVGYENLPQTPPLAPIAARVDAETRRNPFAVRRLLAGLGYQETINFSFVDESWEAGPAGNLQPIRLLNPIANHMGVMRSSLIPSLMQVARFNFDRKADRVAVFELGRVFMRNADVEDGDTTVAGFDQPLRVAGLVCGGARPLSWEGKADGFDFYDAKAHVEALLAPQLLEFEAAEHSALHPGRCARVLIQGVPVGYVGELHPKWRQSWEFAAVPVVFELNLDAVLAREVPQFKSFGKLQTVERDIAVWVEESVNHRQLMEALHAASVDGVLKSATLFDVYRPVVTPDAASASEKSMAIRLQLRRDGVALTEQAIDATVAALIQHLGEALGARLRG